MEAVMKHSLGLLALVLSCVGWAGCSGGADCPDDFPVERDGFCYRADGGGMASTDGGATGVDGSVGSLDGGGGGAVDGSMPADDAGLGDDGGGVICTGTHPLLDGTRRYCEPGDCFCGDPDSCFPAAIAAACCSAAPTCGDADGGTPPPLDGGGGAICTGTHPLLDGSRRYCESGDCFCGDPDNCFPMEIASTCCSVTPVCE